MNKRVVARSALAKYLSSMGPATNITSAILASILAYAQRHSASPSVVMVWLFVIMILSMSRTAAAVAYTSRTAPDDSASVGRWMLWFRVGVLVSGVTWGLAGFLLFPQNDPQQQMFLAFVLAGLTAGGLVSYSADLLSAVAFSVSVLAPIILRLFIAGDGLPVAMSAALLLYLGFMTISLRHIHRHVTDNIILRIEAVAREEAVRINEQRYNLLLKHSPVGILHYDTNFVITYCNQGLANILENSVNNIVGLDMTSLKDQSIMPALRAALDGSTGIYEGRYSATASDASGWVAMTCARVLDGKGGLAGGVAIVRDVTERKEAQDRAARTLAATRALEDVLRLSLVDIPLPLLLKGALDVLLDVPELDLVHQASIFLVEDDHLRLTASVDLPPDLVSRCATIAFGQCLCGQAAAKRRVVFKSVDDDCHGLAFDGASPHGHYGVPILGGSQLIGILNVYVAGGHGRDPEEERFLEMFASTLAGIILRKTIEQDLRDSEEVARTLMNASNDTACLLDATGVILQANAAVAERMGGPPEALVGRRFFDLFPPDLAKRQRQRFEAVLASGQAIDTHDDIDGQAYDQRMYPIAGESGVERVAVFSRDVTHQHAAEKIVEKMVGELRQSRHDADLARRRSELILASAAEGIAGVDRQGVIVFINQAARRMLGWGDDDGPGLHFHARTHDRHADGSAYPVGDCPVHLTLEDGQVRQVKNEVYWRNDGSCFPVEYTTAPIIDDGEVNGAVTIFRDITERKVLEARIERMALFDALTGLPNRSFFDDALKRMAATAIRRGEVLVILYMDLDGFKAVNDGLGHAAGDALLKEIAVRLKATVRAEDIVARMGGDEFVAVTTLHGARDNAGEALAHRIIEVVRQPIPLRTETVVVGVSIGISYFPVCSDRIEECIAFADGAMYKAKRSGKGGISLSERRDRQEAASTAEN